MAFAMATATAKGIPGCVLSVSGPSDFCMEWNAEGQLKRVSLNGNEVARFAYDPSGRRVEKVAGGTTTAYLYDKAAILREVRGSTTLKHVHGPGIDAPLAREEASGALTYYHADGLGSIVRTTSQAGVVVREYRYDAWGNIEAGASEPGFAFTGREWDPETGLYYYRARYYDARVGRFASEDPSSRLATDFVYVGNRPARSKDPLGLFEVRGFSQSRELDVYIAMGSIQRRLKCCAGPYGPSIQRILDDPSLVIEFDQELSDCGRTPSAPLRALGLLAPKVVIGPRAWDCCGGGFPTGVESLGSVILHELAHNAGAIGETLPQYLELACFACKGPLVPN